MHPRPATHVARFSAASSSPWNLRRELLAFTLLELMVSLVLIVGLWALGYGVTDTVRLRVARAAAQKDLGVLVEGLEEYRRHYGDYPRTVLPAELWQALAGYLTPDLRPTVGRRCVPLGRLPLRVDAQGRTEVVDPWGGAYRYGYSATDSAGGIAGVRGFLLYSCGPDGRSGDEERTTRIVDRAHPDNRDNVYAFLP